MAALFDTDVLIDYLRGLPQAESALDDEGLNAYASVVTIAELYQGLREGEQAKLDELVEDLVILDVDVDIAREGGRHRRAYRQSHGSGLEDCLIGATANHYDLTLKTLNTRHFPMVKNVVAPYSKPQRQ
jgi:predicted nucleic acid-binding protein